jgi:hypothetical protein
MTVSTNKTNVMIIKSKKIPCANFMYDNNNLEEVSSYKYLKINLCRKLNWNYSIEKRINRGWKLIMDLKIVVNHHLWLWLWDKKKLLFETLIAHVILYDCKVWGCNISRESWKKN